MSLVAHPRDELGMRLGVAAQHEERRARAGCRAARRGRAAWCQGTGRRRTSARARGRRAAAVMTRPKSGELGVKERPRPRRSTSDARRRRAARPAQPRDRRSRRTSERPRRRDASGRGAEEAPETWRLLTSCAPSCRAQLVVVLLESATRARPGVARDGGAAALASHRAPARRVGRAGTAAPLRSARHRGRAHEQALAAVLHEQLKARDAARDDGPAAAHGLEQHHPERGTVAGRAVHVGATRSSAGRRQSTPARPRRRRRRRAR